MKPPPPSPTTLQLLFSPSLLKFMAAALSLGWIQKKKRFSPWKFAVFYIAALYGTIRYIMKGWERSTDVILGNSIFGTIHVWMWRAFSNFWGVTIEKGFEIVEQFPSDRQMLIAWHPHGVVTWCAACFGATMITDNHPNIPGYNKPLTRQMFAGIAPVIFQLPYIREAMLWSNARLADEKVLKALIDKGHSIGLAPGLTAQRRQQTKHDTTSTPACHRFCLLSGGTKEQMNWRPDKEVLYMPRKRGFVRLAMYGGIPLATNYFFGENQIFHKLPNAFIKLSELLQKYTGLVFPAAIPYPFPRKVRVIFGKLIETGPPNPNPTNAQVEEVYQRYIAELKNVFEMGKSSLPPEVAAKGLTIVDYGKPMNEEATPHKNMAKM